MEEAVSLPGAARRIQLVFEEPEAFRSEYQRNLANGGAFVPTNVGFDLFETVDVELEARFAGETLILRAEIVQRQPRAGVSVQFLDPTPELRALLEPIRARAEELAGPDEAVSAPGDEELGDPNFLCPADLDTLGMELDAAAPVVATDAASNSPPQAEDDEDRTFSARADRWRANVAVRLFTPDGKTLSARTRDLSASGLLLSVEPCDLGVGSDVWISIVHPVSTATFEVAGKVARRENHPNGETSIAVRILAGDRRLELEGFLDRLRRERDARTSQRPSVVPRKPVPRGR
jgi:hypothetical protein